MTKKERILSVALYRFAHEGYNAVSTASIAKEAEVSEGLIFKHFKSKQGLLDTLREELESKMAAKVQPVMEAATAAEALHLVFDLLLNVDPVDFNYWRLQYQLKLNEAYEGHRSAQLYLDRLSWALQESGFPEPEMEAQLLFEIVDSALKRIVFEELPEKEKYIEFLRKKYAP
ncbi:TetR/AcrR family transcriptional regulator [Phaeodactylibacter luteus]|uniref:Helix-turn-helix transcriptional regulator n=1 Tax=Phaeodactylibacter luteus TaxID=1564516 RepID=A0A5C6RFP1_9BACT|nr:helix-turn-helix domain-containing protein [Phaeodactylibacter luteus]TXB59743.1 helix-turn-helix transcriptional regulator [Phaeodactylibacter luteus]